MLVSERAARVGDRVGSGVCRCFHRFGHLVGAAGSCRRSCSSRCYYSAHPCRFEGETNTTAQNQKSKTALPARFWIFAGFALFYGVCETMNGNWASLYMTQRLGASTTLASLALTIFWGTVTAGRILFAAIGRWFSEYRTYQASAFRGGGCLSSQSLSFRKLIPLLGYSGLWIGGSGLLGAVAADHQLWTKRADRYRCLGSGRPDRLLPDGIRHRGFWCRPAAAECRPEFSHHLWLSSDCGADHVGTILCRDETSGSACA